MKLLLLQKTDENLNGQNTGDKGGGGSGSVAPEQRALQASGNEPLKLEKGGLRKLPGRPA